MAENIYLNNRLKYHTASRVAISTSQSMMQATNGDGHTVTSSQVWSSAEGFPFNTGSNKTTSDVLAATNDLVSVFTNGLVEQGVDEDGNHVGAYIVKELNGGEVWRNAIYPSVELYRQVEMTPVEFSDKQAWEVLDEGGSRVTDWVAPTSVKENGLPVPGYTGVFEVASATGSSTWSEMSAVSNKSYGWSLDKGNWEFVYMSGMLTIHPDYVLSNMGFTAKGVARITAFKYVGEYVDETISEVRDSISEVMDSIDEIQEQIDGSIAEAVANAMSIKVFRWDLSKTEAVDGAYTVTVPGFVNKLEASIEDSEGNVSKFQVFADVVQSAGSADGDTNDSSVVTIDGDEMEGISPVISIYALVKASGNAIEIPEEVVEI